MSDMPDLSSLLGMLNDKGIDVNNLMRNLSNNNGSSLNNTSKDNGQTPNLNDILNNVSSNKNSSESMASSNNNFQMPDMETMMKIMKLMNSMNSNKNSPSANLLYSLKPFLRDSKKEKVDQYINFLKISSVISELNKSGGDVK